MPKTIGVFAAEHIALGLVENQQIRGPVRVFPPGNDRAHQLAGMPAEAIVRCLREQIEAVSRTEEVGAVGIGFPGVIRQGLIEDSPNLPQIKGTDLANSLSASLREGERALRVSVFNDADVTAAGIAASQGKLDSLIRVWTLGNGIGFGRYPCSPGVWEGGHMTVTLDPKENYCGCGGVGHLEGIMGTRAMRLRFLDLEPDEVFAEAAEGDARCKAFVDLWHRALAAGTASSIHLDGPGKWFLTGPHAAYVNLTLLEQYVTEMVKMSPLQGSSFQVVSTGDEIGIVGAAVNAEQAIRGAAAA